MGTTNRKRKSRTIAVIKEGLQPPQTSEAALDELAEPPSRAKKAFRTVLAAVALTVVGGTVSDLMVRPGLSWVTRMALSLFTLGSERVRDFPYRLAALDPSFVYHHALLSIGVGFVGGLVIFTVGVLPSLLSPRRPRIAGHWKRILRGGADFYLVVVVMAMFVMLNIFSQASSAWRVFHANIAICAPHLSSNEVIAFRARFAGMSGRADYLSIVEDLRGVAEARGVEIIEAVPW